MNIDHYYKPKTYGTTLGIKISWEYVQLHMLSYLPTKVCDILVSSLRGDLLTNCVMDRCMKGGIGRTKTKISPYQNVGSGGDIE